MHIIVTILIKKYGMDGAYYMLDDKCFKRSADKYQYTVCPFMHVTQSDGRKETVRQC